MTVLFYIKKEKKKKGIESEFFYAALSPNKVCADNP